MFLKTKIYFTIFSLYEIIAGILLHCPRTCDALFGGSFCMSEGYKYFIGMVVIPLLVFLICMWIHEIFIANRHRHSLIYRAKDAAHDAWDTVKNKVSANVSRGDIEKFLTAAALIGVKKYANKHPETKNTLKKIFAQSDVNIADIINEDDDDDDYSDDNAHMRNSTAARRQATSDRTTRSQSATRRRK